MICLKPSSWLASQKVDKNVQLHSRSPYGERGLKFHGHGDGRASGDGRSPYGERGLKYGGHRRPFHHARRSPYGERGLKLRHHHHRRHPRESLSLRRAWIEIPPQTRHTPASASLSLRRAWIEISCDRLDNDIGHRVALLTESVD